MSKKVLCSQQENDPSDSPHTCATTELDTKILEEIRERPNNMKILLKFPQIHRVSKKKNKKVFPLDP